MPSTYSSLHYHIVFSTKNREPLIDPIWRARFHDYLGGCVRSLEGIPQGVGGGADHVHLLVGLKPKHCLADFVRELKKGSSAWAKAELNPRFAWQEGYAAFTVGSEGRAGVRAYIAGQEQHHSKQSFRDELIAMLIEAGVEYDERFLD